LEKTRVVLQRYAEDKYARFGYATSYHKNTTVKAEVDAIIAGIETRVTQIYSKANQRINKLMEMQTQTKIHTQLELENLCSRPVEPLALDGQYGNIKLYMPEYLNCLGPSLKVASEFLTVNFFVSANHIRTARVTESSQSILEYLKPIQFFVIIVIPQKDGGFTLFAEAESHEILKNQMNDLIKCPEEVYDLKHKAFVVTADGHLYQKGKGALTPPDGMVDEILKSKWMRNLKIDAALLRGRIFDVEGILERIQVTGWGPFEKLWGEILHGLPNIEQAYTPVYDELKKKWKLMNNIVDDAESKRDEGKREEESKEELS
jgi:hypothetical protein